MPRRTALLIAMVTLTLGLQAAPAAASLPDYSGSMTFSGGPDSYPNPGSVQSSTCLSDSSPCSVSLTITGTDSQGYVDGTASVTDGGETLSFSWQAGVAGVFGTAQATDQNGHSYLVYGDIYSVLNELGAGGETQGELFFTPSPVCDPSRSGDPTCDTYNVVNNAITPVVAPEAAASGVIAQYQTTGSTSGNTFSASTYSCTSTTSCSLSLSGTGRLPPTALDPVTYTASGTGTLTYRGVTPFSCCTGPINFTFQMTTALCSLEETCGYLTATGSDLTGARVDLQGELTVRGFGATSPFPLIIGSLVFTRVPPTPSPATSAGAARR